MGSRFLRSAAFTAAAFTGLLGAHALDYTLLARDPAVRVRLLDASGHAWVSRAPEFAIAALGVAIVAALALGFRSDRHRTFSRSAVLLSLVQGGAFVALEAGERLAVGARADRLVLVTVVGVALQVSVATLAALVITLLHRAGTIIARALRSSRTAPRAAIVRVERTTFGKARSRFAGTLVLGRAPPVIVG